MDLNKDGQKEILLVSHNRKKIHALEFKNQDLSEFFVRWTAKLPQKLPKDFDRQMVNIFTQGQEMVMIENFALFEKSDKKVKVVDLNQQESDQDDDDD